MTAVANLLTKQNLAVQVGWVDVALIAGNATAMGLCPDAASPHNNWQPQVLPGGIAPKLFAPTCMCVCLHTSLAM